MVSKPKSPLSMLVLLLLLSLVVSCGGPATPQTSEDVGQASDGGADRNGQEIGVTLPFLEITSLDHAYWSAFILVSQGTIFEGLYGYDPELNIVPKIAESATPSAANTVWTIKLRKDKKWSNGDPVTAQDFYVSWMRFLSPELKDVPIWAG